MYSNDILLLLTNIKELQEAVYENYDLKNEIKFNPEETQLIVFGKKLKENEINLPRMYGEEIKMVEKIEYLRIIIFK
ncbi:unnamed protein product [Brachionus calyciflorus]|uniref:Reverse transcriptase domain-containing protein n=1 Tax=Brachionus calyciflorus TaxID=104777 RepID=A0A813M4K9_9BILA|nr:unnamed protein product [Brachionus calyciflorus]